MTVSVISFLEDIRPSESIGTVRFSSASAGEQSVCRYVSREIGPIAFARLLWEPSCLPFCKLTSFSVSLFLSFFPFFRLPGRSSLTLVSCLSRFGHRSFPEDLDGAGYVNRSFRFLRKSLSFMYSMSSLGDTGFCDASRRYDHSVRLVPIPSCREPTSRGRNFDFSTASFIVY